MHRLLGLGVLWLPDVVRDSSGFVGWIWLAEGVGEVCRWRQHDLIEGAWVKVNGSIGVSVRVWRCGVLSHRCEKVEESVGVALRYLVVFFFVNLLQHSSIPTKINFGLDKLEANNKCTREKAQVLYIELSIIHCALEILSTSPKKIIITKSE